LERCFEVDPVDGCFGGGAGTLRAVVVVVGFGEGECYGGERVFVGVIEGPGGDVCGEGVVGLDIRDVQVGGPFEYGGAAVDDCGESGGVRGFVAWDFGGELGDEGGVVEGVFFVGLQIVLGGTHPQGV